MITAVQAVQTGALVQRTFSRRDRIATSKITSDHLNLIDEVAPNLLEKYPEMILFKADLAH
jgi:hypothetical protein